MPRPKAVWHLAGFVDPIRSAKGLTWDDGAVAGDPIRPEAGLGMTGVLGYALDPRVARGGQAPRR